MYRLFQFRTFSRKRVFRVKVTCDFVYPDIYILNNYMSSTSILLMFMTVRFNKSSSVSIIVTYSMKCLARWVHMYVHIQVGKGVRASDVSIQPFFFISTCLLVFIPSWDTFILG